MENKTRTFGRVLVVAVAFGHMNVVVCVVVVVVGNEGGVAPEWAVT
jgi:hypothetical protein